LIHFYKRYKMVDDSGETEQGQTIENDALEHDRETTIQLLKEITQGARIARSSVKGAMEYFKSEPTADGISFIDMKNKLLASYNSNLSLIMLHKCYGKTLQGEEQTILRLAENRTVLEKCKPIDQKLKYQIDKLVKVGETGVMEQNDPLRYKPNASSLMSKLDDESDEDAETEGTKKKKKDAKFIPTRNVPQFFNEGNAEEMEKLEGEKKKKQNISRVMMDHIKDQYSEAPQEYSHKSETVRQAKYIKEDEEKTKWEEDHFSRIQLSRQDKLIAKKRKARSLLTMANVGNDITNFGRNNFELAENGDNNQPEQRGQKRKKVPGHIKRQKAKRLKKFQKRN